MLQFCVPGGTVALVTPQDWLFKTRYRAARQRLLKEYKWDCVVQLGTNAFQDMNWWAANTALIVLSNCLPVASALIAGLNTESVKQQTEKALYLQKSLHCELVSYCNSRIPTPRVVLQSLGASCFLWVEAESRYGLRTGDLEDWPFASGRYPKSPWSGCPFREQFENLAGTVAEKHCFFGTQALDH